MTTGLRAFRGDTAMSTISSILRDEPARAGEVAADVPRDLEKIIARCLRKDPDRRFQHMADVRVALLELKEETESGKVQYAGETPARKVPGRVWAFVAAGLLIAAIGLAVALRSRRTEPGQAPILHAMPLTSYSGRQGAPSFSPDGNQIAFPWTGDQGEAMHLYVKLIGADTPLRLTSDSHSDTAPAWAPDGKSIAFARLVGDNVTLYQIPPIGGAERRIAEMGVPGYRPQLSWSQDGKWLLAAGRKLRASRAGL